jgi:hypothetical protein
MAQIDKPNPNQISRRQAFKKAVAGGLLLYVAPQVVHSQEVKAHGSVSSPLWKGDDDDSKGWKWGRKHDDD